MSARVAHMLRWCGLVGILAIAVMRCLAFFAPQIVFDTDPATAHYMPMVGMGPVESMLLDVILLIACAIALLGEWLVGHSMDGRLMLLAFIPLPVVWWHGAGDAGDLWRGSTWLAAAIACATVAHLAREPMMRTIIIALLAAVIVPMLARSYAQMSYEHAETMQFFQQNKDQYLRERGWEPGSSAAQIYERRLSQPQPLGWFATTNIFASFAAFGVILWTGLTVAAARARLQSGWAGAIAICALAAAVALWMTGSKGAMLAAAAGAMLLVLPLLVPAVTRIIARHAGPIVIVLIALTLLGVIVRGTLLPEGFLGDKSLLFRWHYMVASAHVVAENPLLGVGPDGYQAAYSVHRVPRNPEEVTSSHSMFWDWLCMLGISGTAWIALVLWLMWRSGQALSANATDIERNLTRVQHSHILKNVRMSTEPSATKFALRCAVAIVALGMVPALIIEWSVIDGVSLLMRIIGIAGFVITASVAAFIIHRSSPALVNLSLLASVAALVIHGQIEMTFAQPGAVVWAMCAIGVAGAGREAVQCRCTRWLAASAIGGIVLVAIWIAARGFVPAAQQQRAMFQAAAMLEPLQAQTHDVTVELAQRQAAAAVLVKSYQRWSIDPQPLEAAALQLETAAMRSRTAPSTDLLLQASEIINTAITQHNKSSSLAIAIGINMRLAMLTADVQHWNKAVDLAHDATTRDPHSLSAWRRLGDVLWAANRRAEAAEAYNRALECDANFELDELKRLTDTERQRVQSRIASTTEELNK